MRLRGSITKLIIFCLGGIFGVAWLTSDKPRADQALTDYTEKDGWSRKGDVVFQDRTNNCGVATLKMILDHFGHSTSIRDLERRIAPSVDGTSLHQLTEIAHEFGLQANGWRLTWEDLARIRYPVIMFLRKNHFVVADSLDSPGFLLVRDPATGTMKISRQTLMENWNGETLVFSRASSGSAGTTKTGKRK